METVTFIGFGLLLTFAIWVLSGLLFRTGHRGGPAHP